jgi:hypothetical protein
LYRRLLNLLTGLSLLLCAAVVTARAHAFFAGRLRVVVHESADVVHVVELGTKYVQLVSSVRPEGRTRIVLDLPLGLLAALTAALPAARFSWWLRRIEIGAGLCTNCGHDLTGNVSGVCPECGERGRR